MKAIFINAEEKTVEVVEVGEGIQDIYKLIGCQCFTGAGQYENGDYVYADDEGLFGTPTAFVQLGSVNPQPIAGNVLILGTGEDGESVDVKTSIYDIMGEVVFMTPTEAYIWARANGY